MSVQKCQKIEKNFDLYGVYIRAYIDMSIKYVQYCGFVKRLDII